MISNIFRRLFAVPSARELAQRELDDAKRELLKAQTALDYAACITDSHQARIVRLKIILEDGE